jgi:hypothetical protein
MNLPCSISTGQFSIWTNRFLSIEKWFGGGFFGSDVAVRDGGLKVANLTIDVETQT